MCGVSVYAGYVTTLSTHTHTHAWQDVLQATAAVGNSTQGAAWARQGCCLTRHPPALWVRLTWCCSEPGVLGVQAASYDVEGLGDADVCGIMHHARGQPNGVTRSAVDSSHHQPPEVRDAWPFVLKVNSEMYSRMLWDVNQSRQW